MHYIGSAINRGGQIYTYNKDSRRYRNIDKHNLEWIIDSMGTFSIPIDLLHVLQVVGSFVTGTHSIIFRWAEFTSQLSKDHPISTSDMITLLKSDKIPSMDILNNNSIKERIIHYWENLLTTFPEQFRSEVQVSLLGKTNFEESSWKNNSYNQLISMCSHMIEDRGLDPWINV